MGDIVDTVRETEEKVCKDTGVMTQYARTVCEGRLRDSDEIAVKVCPSRQRRQSLTASFVLSLGARQEDRSDDFVNRDVIPLWDSEREEKVNLFAWLLPEDLAYLGGPTGRTVLEAWLAALPTSSLVQAHTTLDTTLLQSE